MNNGYCSICHQRYDDCKCPTSDPDPPIKKSEEIATKPRKLLITTEGGKSWVINIYEPFIKIID